MPPSSRMLIFVDSPWNIAPSEVAASPPPTPGHLNALLCRARCACCVRMSLRERDFTPETFFVVAVSNPLFVRSVVRAADH